MKAHSLIEVLIAAHLSAYVDSEQFPERGGIMLIAPPGNMKSTFIKTCFKPYMPEAAVLSDINVETLGRMKPHIAGKQILTLAMPAFEKIYQRNPQTANNVEGHIMGLVDEGFANMSFQNHAMLAQIEARCLVVGGLVHAIYQKKFNAWDESGFHRRFIWSSFQLQDPGILIRAIDDWQRLEFENRIPMRPQNKIKMTVTKEETLMIRHIIGQQHCEATPYALMKKIYAVLKWKFHRKDESHLPERIIRDFGTSLGQRMAKLEL